MSERTVYRRAALASFVGTAVEWYDYFIFGTAAALVFGDLFFPEMSPTAGTLAAFATFAVGFLARPLGSVIFSHFGDRVGRKPMMIWSLSIVGVSTVLIGLLPTYETVGIWAPIMLVATRFVQGIGVGGEWGGAALMAVEHAPPEKRGMYGSAPAVGTPAGVLLSSLVMSVMLGITSDAQFLDWGWRVPFLLSAVLILIALVIRFAVEESPIFVEHVRNSPAPVRIPILEVLRNHPKTVAIGVGSFIACNAVFYITSTWVVSYATNEINYERTSILNTIAAVAGLGIVLKIYFGALSDRFGRRPLIITGSVIMIAAAFPYFWLINSGSLLLFFIGAVIAETYRSMCGGPIGAMFSELFETRVRYTGASITFQLAAIVGGAAAPMVCTALLSWTGTYWSIAFYLIAINVVSLSCILIMPETRHRSLTADDVAASTRNNQAPPLGATSADEPSSGHREAAPIHATNRPQEEVR